MIAAVLTIVLLVMAMVLAIEALMTLVWFGFPRSCSVGLLVVLLIVGCIDLMTASVKTFACRGEVSAIRKFKQIVANIDLSERAYKLQVVNPIIYGRWKRQPRPGYNSFFEL